MKSMEDVKRKLEQNDLVNFLHPAQGCTDSEIAQIEGELKLIFPAVYKEFLRKFGRGMGKLFEGSDFEYKYLVELQDQDVVGELVKFAGVSEDRLEKIYVFLLHQGYITCYFYLDEGDDPAVFRFREGDNEVVKIASSFTKFLNNAIDDSNRGRRK